MVDRLPTDLLRAIGCKLNTAGDRIRFRAVSKSWRSALPFRQPPFLIMFTQYRHLMQFTTAGESLPHQIDFPTIIQGQAPHRILLGSAGDWLVIQLVHLSTLALLNPFTGLHFHLPSSTQLKGMSWAEKVVFSSLPRGDDIDVYAGASLWKATKLAILRPGDESWTPVESFLFLEDVVFYKTRVYAITSQTKVLVCDIGENATKPLQLSVVVDYVADESAGARKHYLVEWCGELLVVVRFFSVLNGEYDDGFLRYETNGFKMFKFDFTNMKFDEVKCLGDHSLFLGRYASGSVTASDYIGLVRRNCIYFTEDICFVKSIEGYFQMGRVIENDIGVFDLEDNSITPQFEGTSTPSCYRSVWIFPT